MPLERESAPSALGGTSGVETGATVAPRNLADGVALELADLLLDVLAGNDALAHAALDLMAERRERAARP
jgi:hypothetical protein